MLAHFSLIFAFLSSKNIFLASLVTKILPKLLQRRPILPKNAPKPPKLFKILSKSTKNQCKNLFFRRDFWRFVQQRQSYKTSIKTKKNKGFIDISEDRTYKNLVFFNGKIFEESTSRENSLKTSKKIPGRAPGIPGTPHDPPKTPPRRSKIMQRCF